MPNPNNDAAYHRLALRAFIDFSGSIAVPAVLAVLVGKWLDARFATGSRYTIILLALMLMATTAIIVKKAKYYGREYQKIIDQERQTDANEPND